MKTCFPFLAALGLLVGTVPARPLLAEESYDLSFSTYLGGTGWEHARDVCADSRGNVYICGGTASRDFPTTPGAYQRALCTGDTSGDVCDAFISKFDPDGRLIWSTYLGGPGYDRAYGIYVDAEGNILVTGETSSDDFPVTQNAFQRKFGGTGTTLRVCRRLGCPCTLIEVDKSYCAEIVQEHGMKRSQCAQRARYETTTRVT